MSKQVVKLEPRKVTRSDVKKVMAGYKVGWHLQQYLQHVKNTNKVVIET
jgi:hypothetical protein